MNGGGWVQVLCPKAKFMEGSTDGQRSLGHLVAPFGNTPSVLSDFRVARRGRPLLGSTLTYLLYMSDIFYHVHQSF